MTVDLFNHEQSFLMELNEKEVQSLEENKEKKWGFFFFYSINLILSHLALLKIN